MSKLAKSPQRVHVWVVAPHRVQRVDRDTTRIPTQVRFAGPISGVTGSVRSFVGEGNWLTEFEAEVAQPAQISSDWQFANAATDTRFREVDLQAELVYILSIPGGWFLVGLTGAGLTILVATVAAVLAVRTRKPVAAVSR